MRIFIALLIVVVHSACDVSCLTCEQDNCGCSVSATYDDEQKICKCEAGLQVLSNEPVICCDLSYCQTCSSGSRFECATCNPGMAHVGPTPSRCACETDLYQEAQCFSCPDNCEEEECVEGICSNCKEGFYLDQINNACLKRFDFNKYHESRYFYPRQYILQHIDVYPNNADSQASYKFYFGVLSSSINLKITFPQQYTSESFAQIGCRYLHELIPCYASGKIVTIPIEQVVSKNFMIDIVNVRNPASGPTGVFIVGSDIDEGIVLGNIAIGPAFQTHRNGEIKILRNDSIAKETIVTFSLDLDSTLLLDSHILITVDQRFRLFGVVCREISSGTKLQCSSEENQIDLYPMGFFEQEKEILFSIAGFITPGFSMDDSTFTVSVVNDNVVAESLELPGPIINPGQIKILRTEPINPHALFNTLDPVESLLMLQLTHWIPEGGQIIIQTSVELTDIDTTTSQENMCESSCQILQRKGKCKRIDGTRFAAYDFGLINIEELVQLALPLYSDQEYVTSITTIDQYGNIIDQYESTSETTVREARPSILALGAPYANVTSTLLVESLTLNEDLHAGSEIRFYYPKNTFYTFGRISCYMTSATLADRHLRCSALDDSVRMYIDKNIFSKGIVVSITISKHNGAIRAPEHPGCYQLKLGVFDKNGNTIQWVEDGVSIGLRQVGKKEGEVFLASKYDYASVNDILYTKYALKYTPVSDREPGTEIAFTNLGMPPFGPETFANRTETDIQGPEEVEVNGYYITNGVVLEFPDGLIGGNGTYTFTTLGPSFAPTADWFLTESLDEANQASGPIRTRYITYAINPTEQDFIQLQSIQTIRAGETGTLELLVNLPNDITTSSDLFISFPPQYSISYGSRTNTIIESSLSTTIHIPIDSSNPLTASEVLTFQVTIPYDDCSLCEQCIEAYISDHGGAVTWIDRTKMVYNLQEIFGQITIEMTTGTQNQLLEIFQTNFTTILSVPTSGSIEYEFDSGFLFYDPACEVVGVKAQCVLDTFTNTAKVTPLEVLPANKEIVLQLKDVRMPNTGLPNTTTQFQGVLINVMGECTQTQKGNLLLGPLEAETKGNIELLWQTYNPVNKDMPGELALEFLLNTYAIANSQIVVDLGLDAPEGDCLPYTALVRLADQTYKSKVNLSACDVYKRQMNVTLAEALEISSRYALVIEDIQVPNDHYQDFNIDVRFENISNSDYSTFDAQPDDAEYSLENRVFHRVNYTFDRADETGFDLLPNNEGIISTYLFSLKTRRDIEVDEDIVIQFPFKSRQNQIYVATADKEAIPLCFGKNIGTIDCSYQDELVKVSHSSKIAKGDVFSVSVRKMNPVAGSSGWMKVWTERDYTIEQYADQWAWVEITEPAGELYVKEVTASNPVTSEISDYTVILAHKSAVPLQFVMIFPADYTVQAENYLCDIYNDEITINAQCPMPEPGLIEYVVSTDFLTGDEFSITVRDVVNADNQGSRQYFRFELQDGPRVVARSYAQNLIVELVDIRERLSGPLNLEVIPGTLEEITISMPAYLASNILIQGTVGQDFVQDFSHYFQFTGDMIIPQGESSVTFHLRTSVYAPLGNYVIQWEIIEHHSFSKKIYASPVKTRVVVIDDYPEVTVDVINVVPIGGSSNPVMVRCSKPPAFDLLFEVSNWINDATLEAEDNLIFMPSSIMLTADNPSGEFSVHIEKSQAVDDNAVIQFTLVNENRFRLKHQVQKVFLAEIDNIPSEVRIQATPDANRIHLDVQYDTIGEVYYLLGPKGTPAMEPFEILNAVLTDTLPISLYNSPVQYNVFRSAKNHITLDLELNKEYYIQAFHFNAAAQFGPKFDLEVATDNPVHYLGTVLVYGNVPIYKHTDIANALAIGLGTDERFFVLKDHLTSDKTYMGLYTNFTYFIGYPDDEPVETYDSINLQYMIDAYPEFHWGAGQIDTFDIVTPEWAGEPNIELIGRTITIKGQMTENSRIYAIATIDQFITAYQIINGLNSKMIPTYFNQQTVKTKQMGKMEIVIPEEDDLRKINVFLVAENDVPFFRKQSDIKSTTLTFDEEARTSFDK